MVSNTSYFFYAIRQTLPSPNSFWMRRLISYKTNIYSDVTYTGDCFHKSRPLLVQFNLDAVPVINLYGHNLQNW